ncbi:alkaline phosphatase family protein [Nitrosovibrio tenuis]|uniref:Phospholipase C n=1 Tax=Nitrosovibrio tenuis TaxID=1233 RepID=A0A1H7J6C1_9PROT|nr:alkaline phosphatase family protein [Nitrosovibrio tenuis]SEK68675.1 phospholipase C [Nitrosovibrio tenuis]
MAILDQLQTIVIVMMENRSFDHMLGHLSMARFGNRKDVAGLVDPESNLDYTNFLEGQGYQPFELKDGPLMHDLPHSRARVATQLAKAGTRFTMSGFVDAYYQSTGSKVNDPPPMGFLSPADVTMSNFLAIQYAVCDNWFAPLPTDTQPNRSIAYSGYSMIDDTKPRPIPTVAGTFVFEWLNAHNITWRVYHCGISFFALFDRFEEVLGPNFRSFRQFPGDLAAESVSDMPQVIFVEPEYTDSPVHLGWTPNDNHPPTAVGPGEHFLRDIYQVLTKDPAKWNRTLLIVTHDEHGGFFDHVPPLAISAAVPPGSLFSAAFESTGPRVPSLVASPWISRGTVFKGAMDHTSILQLLSEKFAGTPDYNDEVKRRREAGIQSVSQVLAQPLPQPRTDIPPPPQEIISSSVTLAPATQPQTESQQAFDVAAKKLLKYDRKRALEKYPELVHLPESSPEH